ncbi:hypothetical protein BJF83_01750 [Nocardiopsis sp. CNR-923]|uniref:DUF397 domain-containing protein n=1 Tax=Nocardiopsis sp. CNR-923 TaxID=1904965 RepID=UPI00096912A8|nr:DUF397 domain-containing protein [Nocardiopsis sp. CNR-923]OLT28206.1 hypothetical protein BJF83_01750 [Nocardiopsis sp. CNR-923]
MDSGTDDTGRRWRKSSCSSEETANCVEIAEARGRVDVRDSRNIGLGLLCFPEREWRAFLGSAAGR